MIGRLAHRTRPVFVRARRDVRLAADDRFDAGVLRFLVKFDRAEKIAVIGHGHRRHFEFRRFFHQLLHPHRAIEERVFGVEVEMNEGIAGHLTFSVLSEKIFANLPCSHPERRKTLEKRCTPRTA